MVETQKLFDGVISLIVAGFNGFSKTSAEIIGANINKYGGTALLQQGKPQCLPAFTHILVPTEAQEEKLVAVLGVSREELGRLRVVGSVWAVDCVRLQQLVDVEQYRWRGKAGDCPVKKLKSLQESYPTDTQKEFPTYLPIPTSLATPVLAIESRFIPRKDLPLVSTDLQVPKRHFQFATRLPQANLNEHITSVLEELMKNYAVLRDKGRLFAYRDAVLRLKAHPEKVTSAEQVRGMYRFGGKIIGKIEEILATGTVKRVKAMEEMEYLKALKDFCSIWGVGTTTADTIYKMGYRTIAQLQARPPLFFSQSQLVGLELYEELSEKIARSEVKCISDRVETVAQALAGPRRLTIVPCGSYRRGRDYCGDVDILMSFEDLQPSTGFLNDLVKKLTENGLITHKLQISEEFDQGKKHSHGMFAGIARLPEGKHRRLDLKIYPRKGFAWALLHFTGSADFNRSIRLFAKVKGFKLTDGGVYPTIRDRGETYHGDNSPVCYTEEDIFRLFGMEYKSPQQRDL